MELPSLDDKLAVFGLLAGAFVIIAGLGTLLQQPWATAEGTAPALIQVFGAVLSILVGLFIIAATNERPTQELLPVDF